MRSQITPLLFVAALLVVCLCAPSSDDELGSGKGNHTKPPSPPHKTNYDNASNFLANERTSVRIVALRSSDSRQSAGTWRGFEQPLQ